MENIFKRNELLLQKTVEALIKRNFEAFYCENKQTAFDKVFEIIKKGSSVSWGGSVTLEELDIIKHLKNNDYKVTDRNEAKTPEEKRELVIESLKSDYFLMSANAISEDGELVNIDGMGNRVCALTYGPKNVIVIAGANKTAKTLDEAISRARNHAAPINAQRVSAFFKTETPCIKTGVCLDCKSETSICSQILITRLCRPKGRIKVILVNENLGY